MASTKFLLFAFLVALLFAAAFAKQEEQSSDSSFDGPVAQPLKSGFEYITLDGKLKKLGKNKNALFEYIKKSKGYSYAVKPLPLQIPAVQQTVAGLAAQGIELSQLTLNSGKWMTADFSSAYEWQHTLTILRPTASAMPSLAAVWISSCYNTSDAITQLTCEISQAQTLLSFAQKGVTVVSLTQIPNQTTKFLQSATPTKDFSEDDLVGYTWAQVMANPQKPDVNVYFPMARAISRAMDAVEDYSKAQKKKNAWPAQIEDFYLIGASKRGGCEFLAAAYETQDKKTRLIGASFLVFDLFNVKEVILSQPRKLGGYTFFFADYANNGVLSNADALDGLAKYLDPLNPEYKIALARIPKLLLTTTNDQFFIPTNDEFYWRQIRNDNYQRLIAPGAEHSLAGAINLVLGGIGGHLLGCANVLTGRKAEPLLPQVEFNIDHVNSVITVSSNVPAAAALVYSADTKYNAIDFRAQMMAKDGACPTGYAQSGAICALPTSGAAVNLFNPIAALTPVYNATTERYVYTFTETTGVAQFYRGSYIVMDFGGQYYSTSLLVTPNTEPFPACVGTGCNICNPANLVLPCQVLV